jgi:hypothetical protein
LWVSARPLEPAADDSGYQEIGALYLLQNFPRSDGPAHLVSGASLLQMFYGLELPGFASGLDQFAEGGRGLPRGVRLQDLIELGRMDPPKMVDVLYRIRGSYLDTDDDFRVTTIGYPIVMLRLGDAERRHFHGESAALRRAAATSSGRVRWTR